MIKLRNNHQSKIKGVKMVVQRWTDEMLDELASSVSVLHEDVSELRESVSDVKDSVDGLRITAQ